MLPGGARRAQLVYSPDGYVSVVSMPEGRAPVSESALRVDLAGASAEERAEAAKTVIAYAGRLEVRPDSVVHHIDMALNPNLVGKSVIRRARLEGRDLTLSTETGADGSYRRIHWRRVGPEAPGATG